MNIPHGGQHWNYGGERGQTRLKIYKDGSKSVENSPNTLNLSLEGLVLANSVKMKGLSRNYNTNYKHTMIFFFC